MEQQPLASSQASSHFPLGPVPASTLATAETKRRDANVRLGLCRSGCDDLDDYVLLGGLERGCVVGVSAEEEDRVGVSLGLQILTHGLCEGTLGRALIISPKPLGVMLTALRDGIRVRLAARTTSGDGPVEVPTGQGAVLRQETRELLDRVMLSCVFDVDGLWEVLADLDADGPHEQQPQEPDQHASQAQQDVTVHTETDAVLDDGAAKEVSPPVEIQDSQDEDMSPLSGTPPTSVHNDIIGGDARPAPQHHDDGGTKQPHPDVIVITHVSTLLTTLFTHRDKATARSTLQLLASHLRYLSRSLPSSPLILLLNSTTTSSSSSSGTDDGSGSGSKVPPDPTLRSIFNPPPLGVPGPAYAAASAAAARRNKPSFGLTFAQLLDVHLLCTRVPRAPGGDDGGFVTAVEVLLDDVGVWEPGGASASRRCCRRRREQRWTVVQVDGSGRLEDIFGPRGQVRARSGEIRLAGGFGGRRV